MNALQKIPQLIEKYQRSSEKVQKDVPVLEEVVNGKWRKEDELKELKSELSALERKIRLSLSPQNDPQEKAVEKETETKKMAVVAEVGQEYRGRMGL